MNINSFVKLIKKHYPLETSKQIYTLSQQNTDISTREFLIKEFDVSRFTLPKEITHTFINNRDSTHITIIYGSITLHCVSPYDNAPPIRFLLRIVKRLICLIKMFSIQKSYTIWLLPIPHNRFFPNGSVVEPININGGYTYVNGTTIFVYRYEECAKVLLHELLHHTIFDSYGKWTSEQLNRVRKECNIDSSVELNVNEAIVEFWAVLFECLFISYEYSIPFDILIKKEQEWSYKQSYKLLKYQQKYFSEWKENTNAYCYIVLKTALLLNLEEFLKISSPYSSEILTQFIISNVITLKNRISTMNLKNVATKEKLKFENSSMRMTLFGDI